MKKLTILSLNSRKRKKGTIDYLIINLICGTILILFFYLLFKNSSFSKNEIVERVTELRSKAYASNILTEHYLSAEFLECSAFESSSEFDNIHSRGARRYSDLIQLVIEQPKSTRGLYEALWQECSLEHLKNIGLAVDDIYQIKVYFDNEREILKTKAPLSSEFLLIGNAEFPNFSNKKDSVIVRLFES